MKLDIRDVEIVTPRVPNYIKTKLVKQGEKQWFPVSSFSEEDLREVGKQWTEDLVRRANEQREG